MDTYMTACPECEGFCEVRHPRWGARNCPEPTIPCPLCHGTGEVSLNTAHEWDEEQEDLAQEMQARREAQHEVPESAPCRHCGAQISQDSFAWYNGYVHRPEGYTGYHCPVNTTGWHEPEEEPF